MRYFLGIAAILVLGVGFYFAVTPREIIVYSERGTSVSSIAPVNLPPVPESEIPTSSLLATAAERTIFADSPPQLPLENPPSVVKALYLTRWSAGSPVKLAALLRTIQGTEINAFVIDIKDYSGYLAYKTGLATTAESGAENDLRILHPNALLKKLHENGLYVIGRITVFQDPVLAKAHPEWAITDESRGKTWVDRKGLAWMDPAAEPVWEYNLAIAKNALERGFDEINFDYIRFPSDGDLEHVKFPFWDGMTPMHEVIKNFFVYVRKNLPTAKLSADLFGLATIENGDLGIGQVIEDAYRYFDAVSPMVYPSHYAPNSLGYKNPAAHPYEVITYSLENALLKLTRYNLQKTVSSSSPQGEELKEPSRETTSSSVAAIPLHVKLRPWLQAFDLGAVYNALMIQKEIQAVEDALLYGSSSDVYGGWLLWDPANEYRNYRFR